MALLISVLEQGLIYAIMAFGIYITYKILDFPDLTVDGSFPMGAAIAAALISRDVNPLLTLPICFLLGAVVGTLTGLIHVKLKVRDLLSGIIMMTALYTVNLRIAGRANLPIYNKSTIFQNDLIDKIIPKSLSSFKVVIIVLIITLISKYILDWYLRTKSGMLLRAVGDNDHIITSLGVNKGKVKVVGLAISNGLVALSGCVFAQQQRYFDVSMGTGTMVIGLASVIIGTSLFRKVTILRVTSSVVIGSVIYKACVAIAIRFGFESTDLKFITAALFLLILVHWNGTKQEGQGESRCLNSEKFINTIILAQSMKCACSTILILKSMTVSLLRLSAATVPEKTSMLNIICGSIPIDEGAVLINGTNITNMPEYKRMGRIGRVFQNPSMGTCPSMTILENMAMAENKGKAYNLGKGVNQKKRRSLPRVAPSAESRTGR